MKKKIFILAIMIMTCFTACKSKEKMDSANDVPEETLKLLNERPDDSTRYFDDKGVDETKEENKSNTTSKEKDLGEETPYLVKNFDTDEILGYMQEDDPLVQNVIEDVTTFYKLDCSMKPDNVEETLDKFKKEHMVSKEILTNDVCEEQIKDYKENNRQEDFYNIEIHQLRFREDKDVVTVVATVSYLDTNMDLKINEVESSFEYYNKYDVWAFSGNYNFVNIQ